VVGDINGDGIVNCADLAIIKASFGKKTGQTGFDPRADVNGDGVVNILDLSIVAKQVPAGTTCP
jgi:trimeric autotransporter adhesin